PAGRAVVAQQLQEVIGLPVEVSEVDLGSRSSSLKFRVLEPATGPSPPAEVLSVESATADVSFTDLITRNVAPKELTLRGVNLTLRLDAEGKVLTALPHPTAEAGKGPPPRITIENARVHINQQGQPDFAVSGIAVRAEPRGQKLTLSGTIDDPNWAKWTIAGEADTAAKTGWAELVCPDGPLKVELLKSLPYVPPSIWDDLHPSGRASGKLRAALGADKKLDYLIEVVPKEAALTVPAADATLTGATGSIKFRDAKLT